eukprot:gnl/TRDRNA2_/TRDRNA2_172974_c3_seq2.p1 gnl/TRDRNA2_/TRDRNA2_172974_c3~~gnl/TRDRNA2_/TRDRNA2_172974_c3_seq2.p1  ORF type:complete len:426 (-),score=40.88 gnl/TRDRNA2_/TRDRNA2_172974_c3_seq2:77-1354(-)
MLSIVVNVSWLQWLAFIVQVNGKALVMNGISNFQASLEKFGNMVAYSSVDTVPSSVAFSNLVDDLSSPAFKGLSSHRAVLDNTMLGKSVAPTSSALSKLRPQIAVQLIRATDRGRLQQLKATNKFTGQTIANGKYLVASSPQRSKSGMADIYRAYRSDANGDPVGTELVIKISSDCEAISRENKNYDRVTFGLFSGCFVRKIEFLPETDAQPPSQFFRNKCALVMEAGRKDLAAILAERGGRGLEGRAMRDAAASVAQCIQAVHSSGLVWGDIKVQNFVVVGDEIGDNGGLPGVKGIDVDSAQPRSSYPYKYTPEACPPEYARALEDGTAPDFILEYSYDMFSFGLLLYELATGRAYFGKSKSLSTFARLAVNVFVPDVSDVEDEKLRDLIAKCLSDDPKKRPSIWQALLHPYFTTTGIGPISFR